MRLFVRQATIYSFAEPQSRLIELLRSSPSSFIGQNVIDWQIDVDRDARLKTGRDGHGNETTMVYVEGPVQRVRIAVAGEVLTDDRAGMVAGGPDPLPPLLYTRPTPLTQADEALSALAADAMKAADDNPLDAMHRLTRTLHKAIAFDPEPHDDATGSAIEAIAAGRGVCQDHAHCLIAAARSLGLPARYVSGHVWQEEDQGPRRGGHAWAEVHVPDYGWIGFDPVHDRCPDDRYVRVAIGLDSREAAPLTGARVGGGPEWLEVTVSVTRVRPV